MDGFKVILLAIALLAIAMLGLATQILLKKGGKFPNTHVSGNKSLKSQGISCAQTQDRMERSRVTRKIDYSKVRIDKSGKADK
ncbi:MAG: hypothetical protein WCY58_11015 [Mariniphaga sp.]|nr:hypothetical protein [Mariniphaga sp.]MDD4226197.1 hypothetical protein [Mariniphaga sp.]